MSETIVTVHLADVGAGTALRLLRRAPRPSAVPGLRHADIGTATPLTPGAFPRPTLRRIGLFGFWDDEEAVDRFEADHPTAEALRGGWRARLAPLRMYGSWPGLPDDISRDRTTDHTGASVVLTLGRLRLTQAVRFLRTSARAEAAVLEAPGAIWTTAMVRPPFVATCSLWESTKALSTYAYGAKDPRHREALEADRAKPFHKQSAFVRFRPLRVEGSLSGPSTKNPLPADVLPTEVQP